MKFYLILFTAIIIALSACACGDNKTKVKAEIAFGLHPVDGDSLESAERRIRLVGIDAPEYKQSCRDENGQDYHCGIESLKYLQTLMKDKKISCHCEDKTDRYDRELCICYADDIEINREMVLSGNAVSYRNKYYAALEKTAKKNKIGIWRGKFMRPALYRSLKREQERKWCQSNPEECKIQKAQKKAYNKTQRKKRHSKNK